MMTGRTSPCALPAAMALLLVGLVSADPRLVGMHFPAKMRRALATSSSACAAEVSACSASAACVTCDEEFSAAVDGCPLDDDATCVDLQEAFCCSLAEEDEDCENNAEYSDFIECLEDEAGIDCGVDISQCSGTAVADSDDETFASTDESEDESADSAEGFGSDGAANPARGVAAALCSTAVAGLLVATFGFVV